MAYDLVQGGIPFACDPVREPFQDNLIITDFTVAPQNPGDTYEWYINDVLQAGANDFIFTTPVDPVTNRQVAGEYKAKITPAVGPAEFTPVHLIEEGVQVPVPIIETEDPEAPLGVCSVDPVAVRLRLVGATPPGVTFNWSDGFTDTPYLDANYPDNFVLSVSSTTQCFKASNTISIGEHDNDTPPPIDTNPSTDGEIAPGETVVFETDRSVSWYRSVKSTGPYSFIGRGNQIAVTQGGYFKAKDACGHFSLAYKLNLVGNPKLIFQIFLVGDYVKLTVTDGREDNPAIKTLAFFHKDNIEIALHGYGTKFNSQDYQLIVSNKIDNKGYMNAWRNNYTPEDCMAYLQATLNP